MALDTSALVALASPRRREILRLVWRAEQSAGAIHAAMPDVTFGAVSLQLGTLMRSGLVTVRADGRQRFYRARPEALGPVGAELESMWRDSLWRLKLAAELEESRRGPRRGETASVASASSLTRRGGGAPRNSKKMTRRRDTAKPRAQRGR
jgi:DNA-binding transcriptional ArsR family regulator